MKEKNILVFGDSVIHGYWDTEGGWVQRLRSFIDKKNLTDPDFYCSIYNLGIPGNITTDVLKRFESETEERFDKNEEMIFIFGIGGNDAQFIHSKNDMRTSPEELRNNIKKLIELAKNYSSKIIFVGVAQVDESKTNPIPWATDKYYKNKNLEKYNEIIKYVCEENKVHFVNVIDNFKKPNYKDLLDSDGLHPNSEGHKLIFTIIKDFLIKTKLI
jgi:lysophospholipase L1-like esterase